MLVGTWCHSPAGASAVTLFTFSGATAPISSAIHPPSELPLKLAEGAKIAIISSQMASDTKASGGSYIYRASKAAALNLGRNLATDLRKDGIAVGIYHPGWVKPPRPHPDRPDSATPQNRR